jgi:hypothetical protein
MHILPVIPPLGTSPDVVYRIVRNMRLLPLVLPALLFALSFGCTTTRQQTTLAAEVNELPEEGGRIDGTRNTETRRIDYVVSGTDVAGVERRISVRSLTLIGTRVETDDTWGTAGIIAVSVAAVTGVILIVTGNL